MKFKVRNKIIPNVPIGNDGIIDTEDAELINALQKMDGVTQIRTYHSKKKEQEDETL